MPPGDMKLVYLASILGGSVPVLVEKDDGAVAGRRPYAELLAGTTSSRVPRFAKIRSPGTISKHRHVHGWLEGARRPGGRPGAVPGGCLPRR